MFGEISVFVSHNREDREAAERLLAFLTAQKVEAVFENGERYGQKGWPLEVGERIAACENFVLLWSRNAALSHIIEFEWNLAALLQRRIVIWRLDETALPEKLTNKQHFSDGGFQEIVKRILEFSRKKLQPSDPAVVEEVIKKLHRFNETKPAQVTRKMRIVFL